MEMKLCPNNHYYDQSVHKSCPHWPCTMSADDPGKTTPIPPVGTPGNDRTNAPPPIDDNLTQPPSIDKIGIDPVVGWLVCIEGKEKGRDYRIRADNNFIGRDNDMDIVILKDDTISRRNHAIISYDTRDKVYYFAPSSGKAIVRVNDKAVLSTVEIVANDLIEIGNTKLIFIPLCGEEFDWLE